MADLTNGSGVFQTFTNLGVGVAELGDNKKAKSGQGIAGRTRIINLAKTNMTQAELDAAIQYLQAGGVAGTNDAHTVVGVQPTSPLRPKRSFDEALSLFFKKKLAIPIKNDQIRPYFGLFN